MSKVQITGILQLDELVKSLQSFNEDVRSFANRILNAPKYKDILISYNIYNLNQGIRPDNTPIEKTPVGRQKSTRYERYTVYLADKRGDLKNPDIVDLEGETKSFRSEIDLRIGYNAIYFIDRNWKSEILEGIWGQVLGITEEQLFEFTDLIRPEFEKFAEKRFKTNA